MSRTQQSRSSRISSAFSSKTCVYSSLAPGLPGTDDGTPSQLNPDVNPFQRNYVAQIRRCDEAERRLRFLTTQIHGQGIPMRPLDEIPQLFGSRTGPQAMEELDSRLAESEARVLAMNNSYESLEKRALELEEARQVLRETDAFFREASGRRDEIRGSFDGDSAPLLGDMESGARHVAEESGFGSLDLE